VSLRCPMRTQRATSGCVADVARLFKVAPKSSKFAPDLWDRSAQTRVIVDPKHRCCSQCYGPSKRQIITATPVTTLRQVQTRPTWRAVHIQCRSSSAATSRRRPTAATASHRTVWRCKFCSQVPSHCGLSSTQVGLASFCSSL
jgi:hypothetical protein